MAKDKIYWKGFDHLANTEVSKRLSENEFSEDIPIDQFLGDDNLMSNSSTTRRDFLKYLGFSTAENVDSLKMSIRSRKKKTPVAEEENPIWKIKGKTKLKA